MEVVVKIKPLSVNQAWRGRRWKTRDYSDYEKDLLLLLPKMNVPNGRLSIKLVFGLSSRSGDLDNPVKPFVDVLQKKYGFDDKVIYEMHVQKEIVSKGDEYIQFDIKCVRAQF